MDCDHFHPSELIEKVMLETNINNFIFINRNNHQKVQELFKKHSLPN